MTTMLDPTPDGIGEAIRRSVKAVLIGGYFHTDHTEKLGLNDEAKATIYTEIHAQMIYMVSSIVKNKLAPHYGFITNEYVQNHIKRAIEDFERENGMVPGSMVSIIFRRCIENDQMSPEERREHKHILMSAQMVKKADPNADVSEIVSVISSYVHKFFDDVISKFGSFTKKDNRSTGCLGVIICIFFLFSYTLWKVFI